MTTSIHITALDGIINVNSLFTLAVFVGLAWNPADPTNTLIGSSDLISCSPSAQTAKDLISFHVYSFSAFLFSSLIALALKQAIRIAKTSDHTHGTYLQAAEHLLAHVNKNLVRVGMLVSGIGSVCGCVFLMLALVNVVQLKLGSLGCGSGHSYAAIVPLVILVPVALLVYVSIVLIKEKWDHASTYMDGDFLVFVPRTLSNSNYVEVELLNQQFGINDAFWVSEVYRWKTRSTGTDKCILFLPCQEFKVAYIMKLTVYSDEGSTCVIGLKSLGKLGMQCGRSSIGLFSQVDGAGECGKTTTPDKEAFKLAPCASAAQDENASVSSPCCAQVKKIGQNPPCLCAVMLSNTAKSSGVDPKIAMTIPKRCNIADRPVGYKCGDLLLFSCSLHFTLKNE
ncbi:hypothetical protein SADUNF_Sadunf10G0150100 [Salix dunnii]|uniref:Bifunctional inhibitor/plant lipid transfer protein/seed storage helical domain-containing protein n=1 Tax=Salix dunnii TaxID=1413687 RepID=A0A835MR67_9ROSI|nr:hypothetical protein SADUNF_Sadunf10G0150100 [Salix dunnii]